ncbi:arsenate reductase ArsC [Desulfurobacterium atlanticum]|uniref:Arsenate reductase n=1 Tax=Desulfurobacterium atlanticum TaxID=240169 RepID=A0A238YRK8_9BACT|nr:arsenate reductase ArsC [Desulfurobacterium atlanticum]SNR73448.1 arsenate reductase [Desulfurobacterium atlanticum]
MKKKVLFVCTHNSARSQMAEGILRAVYGDRYDVYSAGTKSTGVNKYAVKVMREIGIDISSHTSKKVEELKGIEFDVVVTVCDSAKESCPYIPGAKRYVHKSFKDPSSATGDEEEILETFRKVRDEIKSWIVEEFSN